MEDKTIDKKNTASIAARIIAFLIDSIIVFLLVTLLDKTIFKLNPDNSITSQISDSINKGLFFSFYYIIFGNFLSKGRSIGKIIMNIKIVKDNNEEIDLMTLLNREILCRVFIERINLWILLLLSYTGALQQLTSGIDSGSISPIIWYIISMPWAMIISFAMMVSNSQHLSLHDRISKTKVISLK